MEVKMKEIILRGHKVAKGKGQGQALVFREPFTFVDGINPENGTIIVKGHQYEGTSVTGKVLVFPFEKGSTGPAFYLYEMMLNGTQPQGIINLRADSVLTVGVIISNIPMVDRLDGNPMEIIETGDYVEIDADQGIVKIRKA
jgi:predicted aconitase with swiveling domain